jgi:hypothetical protein
VTREFYQRQKSDPIVDAFFKFATRRHFQAQVKQSFKQLLQVQIYSPVLLAMGLTGTPKEAADAT